MPNPALPASVQRQLEEASALERQLYGQAPTDPVVNTDPNTPAPTPEAPPNTDPAPAPEPQKVQPVEDDTFQHKYNVLQHKYNAEVPRLHAQLREAVANITQLTAEVQRLQQAQAQAAQQPTLPTSEEDAERFGEDLLEVIDRRATALAQQMLASRERELTAHIGKLEAHVNSVDERVALTDQDRFFNALTDKVPNWKATNVDQAWLAWLREVDPVYGQPRQAALDAAANAFDVERVAAIFKTFYELTGKLNQPKAQETARKQLERQLAPQPATSAATPQPAGQIWTKAEYEHAYDPRVHRQVGADKAAQMMAEADKALAEGRVQF